MEPSESPLLTTYQPSDGTSAFLAAGFDAVEARFAVAAEALRGFTDFISEGANTRPPGGIFIVEPGKRTLSLAILLQTTSSSMLTPQFLAIFQSESPFLTV
eukprot:TRINITY_DN18692_c0_g1_i1.p5 TRINITY_DN18692_c0_g1~~TRINITY_DN18692_c0_g1_i1.p5  ORF type:complete len:101 (+),score=4.09 TRINITY_DN18692_c0_g1_i1:973-1275(+)